MNIETGTQIIVAPRVGAHRCGNCKHQGQLPEFVDGQTGAAHKLCLANPPTVTPVFVFRIAQAGFEGGTRKEVSFPPAPDHWTCGQWAPRFVDTDGNKVE